MNMVVGLFMAVVIVLAGCASPGPSVYRNERPSLDVQRYFDGTLVGHGLFMDRTGEVKRRFVVTIRASWAGDIGTLDEHFSWADGRKERRVWTLRRVAVPAGDDFSVRWSGTAADVIGEARGDVSGNSLRWAYRFDLRTDEGTRYEVDFDDQMYLIDDTVMLNRAVMSFYGIRVGELLISFRKLS